jgi:hypothetical protein
VSIKVTPFSTARCLPRRHFDPPHRRGADADGAVNDGAEIAPVNPSRKPPAPAPETPPSGQTDASTAHAVIAPAWRFAWHPPPRRIRWVKLHKAQLASDRTSCRSPLANQMRLTVRFGPHKIKAAGNKHENAC